MAKHDFLYSLTYKGELRKGFPRQGAVEFLMENFDVKQSEAIEILENEYSVCRNTPYNDVLKVHKEFFAAGIVLILSKEKEKPKAPTKAKKKAKKTKQPSKITVRECRTS